MHVGQTSGSSVTVFGADWELNLLIQGPISDCRFTIHREVQRLLLNMPEDLNFGTSYFVVVKFDRSTAPTTAYLWVNPPP